MAQSTCTALMEAGGHVYAVRRECSATSVSCQDLCTGLKCVVFTLVNVYLVLSLFSIYVGKY